jgi:histidinol-phosphate/aromatic aminotransferase/cobyric acid decarboxylase-like protein
MELRLATEGDLIEIRRIRHDVYAAELGQHPRNEAGALTDDLDGHNVFLVAARGETVVGFVSVTPPWLGRYSVDKYLRRADWPGLRDAAALFEVRLLTVPRGHRSGAAAGLLMYAALRWVQAHGGRRVVAIGRVEVLSLYIRAGLRPLGFRFRSGECEFELMEAAVADLATRAARTRPALERALTRWDLPMPWQPSGAGGAFHGGASFAAIGTAFDALDRRERIIPADVLDAWFPPAPGVVEALREHAGWVIRSSPPTHADGLVAAISAARGVPPEAIAVGAGSSDLVFRAFGRWLSPGSRVLLPEPTYGEYAHVLEHVVGARVDRLPLRAEEDWRLDPGRLADAVSTGRYDLVVLVNPNNPTGRYAPDLAETVRQVPPHTRVWVDEAYLEYTGGASLEHLAARSPNVVVCKSMSKVYGLSGVRVAYLVTAPAVAAELRRWTPPWQVGLPGQIAAVRALAEPAWYAARWAETAALRGRLAGALRETGVAVDDDVAGNFVLIDVPSAMALVTRARRDGVYLRDLSDLSSAYRGRAVRVSVRPEREHARIVAAVGGSSAQPVLSARDGVVAQR